MQLNHRTSSDAHLIARLHDLPLHQRIPDDIDAWLAGLARAGQAGDIDARNLVFEALRPRFAPMYRRIRANPIWRSREGRAWAFDDLEQETFLIVCELIQVWKGGDTIVGYFFARLPWRLRDVLRRWTRPARLDKPGLPIGLPVDDVTDLVQVRAVLERVFQGLPGRDANVLRMRVIEGLSDEKIGARLRVNPRTIRRWRQQAYPQAQAIYLAERATASS